MMESKRYRINSFVLFANGNMCLLIASLMLATMHVSSSPPSPPPVSCDLDGLWHQSAGPGKSVLTASLKTGSGPQGSGFRSPQALPAFSSRDPVPDGFYSVSHAAIGCGSNNKCLNGTGHGCDSVFSGSANQCVWKSGVQAAATGCSAWAECVGFWCGTATDVPTSQNSWCWARGNDNLIHAGAFQNDTSYIKTSIPHALELKCTSNGCGWIWATGEVNRATGAMSITFDDGNTTTATVRDNCSTIMWANGDVWTNQMLAIQKVHVVYMAHFDVGYTSPNVQALLDVYATQYFPQVFSVAETMRTVYPNRTDLQYKWTSHPWLLLALLQNQTGSVPLGFPDLLEAAIRRGDVLYHANPMNMQGEAGELVNMDSGMVEAERLDAYFGQSKKIAASQKDEPGATLGMVRLFNRHGVKMLHIGANDFSTVPALPSISAAYHGFCNPFLWGDSELANNETDLLMLYCSGYSGSYELGIEAPNMMAVIPGSDQALAYLMHVDNRGPQNVAQVLEGIAAVHRNFPNAEVVPSSMDAWTTAIVSSLPTLPEGSLPRLVDVEPGSTWVQGVGSDPYKIRRYRAVARAAANAVGEGRVDVEDPRYVLFQDLLLKEPEHTWGVSSACEGDYTDAQFYNPKYACTFGTTEYNVTVKSFLDQRQFVDRAVAALGALPLRSECEDALNQSKPEVPSLSGLNPFTLTTSPIEVGGGINVTFNTSGAIVGLTRNGGRELASASNPIGLFSYAKHSGAVLDHWGSTYGLEQCSTSCGHCSFSKCGYPDHIVQAVTAAIVTGAWASVTRDKFVFNLTFGSSGVLDSPKFGAPPFAYLSVVITASTTDTTSVELAYDLSWFNKPATRAAESMWFTVSPLGYAQTGWTMEKLGRWVDPLNVPVNGSRTRHAVWSGVRHADGHGGFDVQINTTDAPLVIVGENTYDPNGAVGASVDVRPDLGWSFNLWNNAWATNFPTFSIDAEQRFRFNVKLG
eukprot:m.119825 g.119825  ORF g.119825 m.119825 type:complete len:974 (-) comp28768_c0_seq1:249-3170(-)